MKKHNLAEFLKSKSFYALLCVGALAIGVITLVGLNQSSENKEYNNLVDLNEPNDSDVADGKDQIGNGSDTNNTNSDVTANNEGSDLSDVAKGDTDKPVTDGSLLEFDDYDGPKGTDASKNDTSKEDASTEDAEAETNEENIPVINPDSLSFNPENKILMPVYGNVIMNYSPDTPIQFATLAEYKCNPAIVIKADTGTEVLSAAKGIVTSIEESKVTGLTVKVSIGSGYSLVYGQLKDLTVKKDDVIEEGQVLGKIAEPSRYYVVEGSNLYFQVFKDEETVNPMSLIRLEDEEE